MSSLEGVVLPGNVVTLDLTDLIGEPDLCRSVVGNVLVFWDSGHVSATYMRTLAHELEHRLVIATGW